MQPGSFRMSSRHLKARIQMPWVASVSSDSLQSGCSSWTYSGRKPDCTIRRLLLSFAASLFNAATTSSAEKPDVRDRCSLPFSAPDSRLWMNWKVVSSEFSASFSSSLITNAWNHIKMVSSQGSTRHHYHTSATTTTTKDLDHKSLHISVLCTTFCSRQLIENVGLGYV